MKNPAKSNIYSDAKAADLAPYAHAIEGDMDAPACIVGFGALPDEVSSALFAACGRIGMPDPNVVDASLFQGSGEAFAAIEGLDPAVLIVADEVAAALLSEAYRAPVELDASGRLFGRPYAAFASFQADLSKASLKQRDWALLKTLKRSVRSLR